MNYNHNRILYFYADGTIFTTKLTALHPKLPNTQGEKLLQHTSHIES